MLLFGMPGYGEMFIILLIIVIIFGAKKLPELGSGLGKGIKNFQESFRSSGRDQPKEELAERNEHRSPSDDRQ